MSTPSSTTNSTAGVSASRWAALGDSSSKSGPFSRGGNRGRGNGRGGRGGGRGGGRNGTNVRESKADPVKPQASQEKPKPHLAKVSTTAPSHPDPSEQTISTPRSKNSSRRLSRSTPAPIAPVQLSTPSAELPTPISRTSNSNSNRRRRSTANKAPNLPKIKSPAPDDNLLRPDRPVLPTVPHTAPPPTRDAPPHLTNHQNSPAEMRTNIDALVERVRAVAMADNRPSTPGSHIDWAGDDDDSLPDLNDWGIPTITAAQTISPIIVDGLKPLPEPLSKPSSGQSSTLPVKSSSPLASKAVIPPKKEQTARRQQPLAVVQAHLDAGSNRGRGKNSLHPSLPSKPAPVTSQVFPVTKSTGVAPVQTLSSNQASPAERSSEGPKSSPGAPQSISPSPVSSDVPTKPAPCIKVVDQPPLTVTIVDDTPEPASLASASPNQEKKEASKISSSARDPLFGRIGNDEGLAASIHAPKPSPITDAASAPPNLSTYNHLPGPRPRREPHFTHTRRPASFNSHPRNPRPNNSGRGYGQHSRNHSSPHTSAVDGSHNRLPHARPVITGDAISRLARTIVSGAPKSAPAVSATTD